jgi:hypothetical protein
LRLQLEHPLLSLGVLPCQVLLRERNGFVAQMANQLVGCFPSFFLRLADNDMEPDSEPEFALLFGGGSANPGDLFGNLIWWFSPGKIVINVPSGHVDTGRRRATKIKGWTWMLDRPENRFRTIYFEMLSFEIDLVSVRQNRASDIEKLIGDLVTRVMLLKNSVTCEFNRISTGYHIDQKTTVAKPVESRCHPGGERWRDQPGSHRNKESHAVGVPN